MRYHGVDLHKKYATISVRNEVGTEEKFVRAQADIKGYVASLGREDAVVLEASAGALYWAEKIQSQGASCVVIDAYRFRIICDSWQKTDKRDAANLSLALWLASRSGEMKLPEVWQPGAVVRELRRYFGLYELLNKQIRQLKNEIHGVLLDNGVRDRALGTRLANSPTRAEERLKTVELSAASRVCIQTSLALLASLQNQKETLRREICQAGRPLETEVKLLISIRGLTPLLALALVLTEHILHKILSTSLTLRNGIFDSKGVVDAVESEVGDGGEVQLRHGVVGQPNHHERVVQVVWDLSNPWLRLHQALFPGRICRTRRATSSPAARVEQDCGVRGAAHHPATQERPPQRTADNSRASERGYGLACLAGCFYD